MAITRSSSVQSSSPTPSENSDLYYKDFDGDTPSPAPSQTADAFGWESEGTPVPTDPREVTPTPQVARTPSPASVVEITAEEFLALSLSPAPAPAPATGVKARAKTLKAKKGKGKAKPAEPRCRTYPYQQAGRRRPIPCRRSRARYRRLTQAHWASRRAMAQVPTAPRPRAAPGSPLKRQRANTAGDSSAPGPSPVTAHDTPAPTVLTGAPTNYDTALAFAAVAAAPGTTFARSPEITSIPCLPDWLKIYLRKIYRGPMIHAISHSAAEFRKIVTIVVSPAGVIEKIQESDMDPRSGDTKIVAKKGEFLMPGFVDTHTFSNLGIGEGYELLDWLSKVTFPTEEKFGDINVAKKVYAAVVKNLLVFGKCNMDKNAAYTAYVEKDAATSIDETKKLIEYIRSVNPDTKVDAIITPRFALSCSSDLLTRLGKLAGEYSPPVRIQTHISENKAEVRQVLTQFPDCRSYAAVYDKFGLLREGTILAHGCWLENEELKLQLFAVQQARTFFLPFLAFFDRFLSNTSLALNSHSIALKISSFEPHWKTAGDGLFRFLL
ncbi:hypothetical protein GGX14DRAFT_632480 [Mycena pura]|uniref:Amidohydrolase-related domain-containing protein n=1 Tax=Mycena pura TaxID=153505 RepID=A0AAD6VGV4_9AGAR|nr:hypothetical protein GGX14DRAFT_632480 [Mycena pura]